MRLFLCEKFYSFCRSFFSGSRVGEMGETASLSAGEIRQCANCKSRKAPDVRCPFNATYGDYCSRHWKHPNRFIPKGFIAQEACFTRRQVAAARRIQAAWRRVAGALRFQAQGPAANDRSLSCNDTEFYSLDSVSLIPPLYLFSMISPQRVVWSFDIRSLGQMVMKGTLTQNPYTREPLGDRTLRRIHDRLTWLRRRKYSVLHPQGSADLTAEQIWNQHVLDVFLRIESFGFHVSCDWFHDMSVTAHEDFYKTLFGLWYGRLGLTMAQRETIVPGGESPTRRLFRFTPGQEPSRRSVTWWQRHNLALMEAFVSRSQDKENQRLGAMYLLMGLVAVCEEAEESFPWLADVL